MTPEQWAEKVLANLANRFYGGRLCHVHQHGEKFTITNVTHELHRNFADAIHSAIAEAMNAGLPGTPLGDEELEAIRKRERLATAGPWTFTNWPSVIRPRPPGLPADPQVSEYPVYAEQLHTIETHDPTLPDHGDADAVFIASARQDIPALLAHIDYQNALFRDMADTGELGAYRRGYADGVKGTEELRGLLREVEWPCEGRCRICGGSRWLTAGHAADCRLAKALGTSE